MITPQSNQEGIPIKPAHQPFLWGAATSAFQIEGSSNPTQRGQNIWDAYCEVSGNISDGGTGEIACDHVRRYREDVALLKSLNVNAYRFSISWPRVLPTGVGAVNSQGLDFYDQLIDELLQAGIAPCPTLYHWDLPNDLQERLGGWEHADTARHFADFSKIVFDRLGDRAKQWFTINEPWCVAYGGYISGAFAPGIRDRARGLRVGHELLRAHALSVAAFRSGGYAGTIGIGLNSPFMFPATDSPVDRAAAERALLDVAGWFGDPVWFGDYPDTLRAAYGKELPVFTDEDQRMLHRSIDFIATNYYSSDIVRHDPNNGPLEFVCEPFPDRPRTAMDWAIVPEGLESLLTWLSERYGGLPVYVTENGIALADEAVVENRVQDTQRIDYLRTHFAAARRAMDSGVDLRGFFVWSLMDNFEWAFGYSKRFGLIRCDYETQVRTIKDSGRWYANWITSGGWSGGESLHPETTATVGKQK